MANGMSFLLWRVDTSLIQKGSRTPVESLSIRAVRIFILLEMFKYQSEFTRIGGFPLAGGES